MYDQSFSDSTLRRHFAPSDFDDVPLDQRPSFRTETLGLAVERARQRLRGLNPFQEFDLGGKAAFRTVDLATALVLRKLTWNLERQLTKRPVGRNAIITKLIKLLREGVPYRVYRIDIKSFFESFNHNLIKKEVSILYPLSVLSKDILNSALAHLSSLNCEGLPRGLRISSTLSELLMADFDTKIRNHAEVFFFDRYVDDIIVITSGQENRHSFLEHLESTLPPGLVLNRKKLQVSEISEKSAYEPGAPPALCNLDYLGYSFTVSNPSRVGAENKPPFRNVTVDIAKSKVTRYKFRISRSLLDFSRNGNFSLLAKRIKFLTSNFRINKNTKAITCLAGVFYGYPHLSPDSAQLKDLDNFLRKAIRSNSAGRQRHQGSQLTPHQKRLLLTNSFQRGHTMKAFCHFHPTVIATIQTCWNYE